jgi:hypothetical protein
LRFLFWLKKVFHLLFGARHGHFVSHQRFNYLSATPFPCWRIKAKLLLVMENFPEPIQCDWCSQLAVLNVQVSGNFIERKIWALFSKASQTHLAKRREVSSLFIAVEAAKAHSQLSQPLRRRSPLF